MKNKIFIFPHRNGSSWEPHKQSEMHKVFQYYKKSLANPKQVQFLWTGIAKIQLKVVDTGAPVIGSFWAYISNLMSTPKNIWMKGEPNDVKKKENCAEMRNGDAINDVPCSDPKYKRLVVCEYKLDRDVTNSIHNLLFYMKLKQKGNLK